jgi:hypothetical protein
VEQLADFFQQRKAGDEIVDAGGERKIRIKERKSGGHGGKHQTPKLRAMPEKKKNMIQSLVPKPKRVMVRIWRSARRIQATLAKWS